MYMADFRIETDSMGQVNVPSKGYWGAQTQRAVDNFSISPLRIPEEMIKSLALVKKHAAIVNKKKKEIPKKLANAIIQAASEVITGKYNDQFPIDVFQTGSGTSWNMNINEVLANRANELLGSDLGSKNPVHPNDHVNSGQSSNDSIPTAIYVACRLSLPKLINSAKRLAQSFRSKSKEFANMIKLGRTHLQDAVPMTLGQEFGAFATQVEYAVTQLERIAQDLSEIPQGGSAVGTGLNVAKGFATAFAASLSEETKIKFTHTKSPFSRMAAAEPFVALGGALNVLSVALMKIANDLRLLASGPRAALGEIELPSLQPGSSIMPGKVNPVIPEMVIQTAAHLMGKAESLKISGQNAPLQLIMMFPIIAYEALSSIELAANACDVFKKRCVDNIKGNTEEMKNWIERSLALVTPLAVHIGYDKAAAFAHKAFHEKRTIRDVLESEEIISVKSNKIISKAELDTLLDPKSMI